MHPVSQTAVFPCLFFTEGHPSLLSPVGPKRPSPASSPATTLAANVQGISANPTKAPRLASTPKAGWTSLDGGSPKPGGIPQTAKRVDDALAELANKKKEGTDRCEANHPHTKAQLMHIHQTHTPGPDLDGSPWGQTPPQPTPPHSARPHPDAQHTTLFSNTPSQHPSSPLTRTRWQVMNIIWRCHKLAPSLYTKMLDVRAGLGSVAWR